MTDDLTTLAHWLAGEFENQAQSAEQPAWFVHLRWWHRPFSARLDGKLAIFAEQANALYLDRPYRQRVLVLSKVAGTLQVQYFAFKTVDRVIGSGANPDRLQSITVDDLELLPGCKLTVTQHNDRFVAQPEPDAKCFFHYAGESRQVVLGFEVSCDRYYSHDKGVDPATGQGLWGALMGAYEFEKMRSFADQFPS